MKKTLTYTIIFLSFFDLVFSQDKKQNDTEQTKKWAFENITIGQSMATSEEQELPAQLSVTFPKGKKASYLINTGININFKIDRWPKLLGSFTGEYHRNTLTDKEQNNIQLGIKGHYNFASEPETKYILIFDPQFSRDFVEDKNSIQSNLLFTWVTNNKPLNFGAHNYLNKKETIATKISIIAGAQFQNVFHGDANQDLRGFKFRPIGTVNAGIYFLRNESDPTDPVVDITAAYTQRLIVINSTADSEKNTYQFTSSINYYIATNPVKLSIGGTFLDGSDPYTALKQQQYFLISFNVFLN
ncbi:hypothetical protein [Chryseobacterium sp. JV274]|uniref:hypothetical protein n=1 Tax=Chryseobacterium sp. JV274 TaxID=1932669 RepID=UPI0015C1D5A9|nr:hypothetical protein [Chryseobacterium sp. JV274]CAD0218290.1 conserved protein of unknown function [Chryseobacterium sp. JV274]